MSDFIDGVVAGLTAKLGELVKDKDKDPITIGDMAAKLAPCVVKAIEAYHEAPVMHPHPAIKLSEYVRSDKATLEQHQRRLAALTALQELETNQWRPRG